MVDEDVSIKGADAKKKGSSLYGRDGDGEYEPREVKSYSNRTRARRT